MVADATPADASALRAAFALHTRLFLNCLDDVTADHAGTRVGPVSSIVFIACHLVDVRHFTARALGDAAPNPLEPLLGDARGIDDVPELPGLPQVRSWWADVSHAVEHHAGSLSAAALAAPAPQAFPIEDPSLRGALQFLLHHEAYHIGQLALLRRIHGYAAMGYGRRS